MLPIRRHLLLILLLLAGIADAQARNGQSRNQAPVNAPPAGQSAAAQPPAQSDSSLPDSVRRVEKETGGEVLRAEPIQASGRQVYRLKVLTPQGRIREVRDDPRRHRQDKDHPQTSSDSEDDDERSQ